MNPDLMFVLVIALPLVLLAFVARTRLSWVPGIIVMAGAMALMSMKEDLHGDVGGIGAFANGVRALEGMGLLIFGVILLAVGGKPSRKPDRGQPTALPVATVVAGAKED